MVGEYFYMFHIGGGKSDLPTKFDLVGYNLRDHMDDFELILTMLGERATMEIYRTEGSKGLPKLKKDAKAGGDVAGGTRKRLEKTLKRSIVTGKNYLPKLKV